eukprot:252940-Pelagomonas_calceolata.AAC.1
MEIFNSKILGVRRDHSPLWYFPDLKDPLKSQMHAKYRLQDRLAMLTVRKAYEKTVHGEWQTSQEPSERKDEIDRGEGQRTMVTIVTMSTLKKNMFSSCTS